MSSLSEDLNSYLKRGNNSGSSTSLSSVTSALSAFKLPTLKTPFGGSSASTPEDEEPFLGVSADGGHAGKTESQSWLAKKISGCLPSLSKKQRIIGFMGSLILGTICFGLAISFLPMLVINPRKFSLLFSLGSLFTISSFSFLWGPYNHITHLFGKERLPFTAVYFTTLIGTLYFAMGLQSAILTPIAAILQVIALVWFVVSYIPGGQTGLKFFTKLCSGFCRSTVNQKLPV
jgi:hypothetical protein